MWFKKTPLQPDIPQRPNVAIRLEAVGGQGAHSAGKILAEAAVLKAGYTGNHFSSFGSEKRGTPVRSFVRFSVEHKPVRSASHIQNPDILVIFHESLLLSHPEILDGATDRTDVIINSASSPEKLHFPEGSVFRSVATIDATTMALNHQCGINAVMLGAIAKFCPEISSADISDTLQAYFSGRKNIKSTGNMDGFLAGHKDTRWSSFRGGQSDVQRVSSPLPEMGWMNAPIGGVIVNPGNSVLKDHSASRKGIAPQFNKEICFNCGYCDMVCPDFCFVWSLDPEGKKSPVLQGIDYQYCKGCQKCVAVCPVEALQPVLEKNLTAEDKKNKAYPEVDRQAIEDRWKHLDWTAFIDQISAQERMMSPQTELLDPASYLRPHFSDDIKDKSKKESKS